MNNARLERWIERKLRLRHLQLIAEVYDSRSILKASKRLHVTQPAVTKALQDVEATLNLLLFERTNRGLTPTPYGEIFARHSKTVLAELRHAAEELENFRTGHGGHVFVGTLLAASANLLPKAIALLKKERPGVAITIMDGTYDLLLPALLLGDLDMVLGRLPDVGRNGALTYEEFYAEPSCLVTRFGHPLFQTAHLSLGDLVDYPWVLPLKETSIRRQIENMFTDEGVNLPHNITESLSILTNRVLLRESDCIGLMPYHVALDDVEHGFLAILPVALPSVTSPVGAITRTSGNLAPAAQALHACLRTVSTKMSSEGSSKFRPYEEASISAKSGSPRLVAA